MDRGQIVFAPFLYSDQEGSKSRPVCVVSTPEFNLGPDVIVAMVTSSPRRLIHPEIGDVVVRDWVAAGLRVPSVIRTGRVLVLEHRFLRLTLGHLSLFDLAAVDFGLSAVLGLT